MHGSTPASRVALPLVVQGGRAGLDRRRARLRLNAGAVGVRLDALCGISVARPTSSPRCHWRSCSPPAARSHHPWSRSTPRRTSPPTRRSGDRAASNGASPPVEHVRTHCPAAIATLVAIARTAEDDEGSTANRRRIAAAADRHEGR